MKNLMVVVVSAVALASFGYTVDPGVTLKVNDSNVDSFAGGIEFADATGTVEFDTSAAPTMAITGQGTCVKTSSAAWTMSTDRTAFEGKWIIRNGVVSPSVQGAFNKGEAKPGQDVVICPGATLHLPSFVAGAMLLNACLHISGTGYENQGAIKTDYTWAAYSKTCNSFTRITLDDDATICGAGATERVSELLDMNGHTLTLSSGSGTGAAGWYLSNTVVTNRGTLYYPACPTYTWLGNMKVRDEAPYGDIRVKAGAFHIWSDENPAGPTTEPICRNFIFEGDGCAFSHGHRFTTSSNVGKPLAKCDCPMTVKGDVTLPTGGTLSVGGGYQNCQNVFEGVVKGGGNIKVEGAQPGRYVFANPTNTFTGTFTCLATAKGAQRGTVEFGGEKSLPDYSKFTAGPYSTAIMVESDNIRWPLASLYAFANEANWNARSSLGFDPDVSPDMTYEIDGSAYLANTSATAPGLAADSISGDGTVVAHFDTDAPRPFNVASFGGTMVVTGEGRIMVNPFAGDVPHVPGETPQCVLRFDGAKHVALDIDGANGKPAYIGGRGSPVYADYPANMEFTGEMVVTNSTVVGPVDAASADAKNHNKYLRIGAYGTGILTVEDGSLVSNLVQLGYWDTGWNDSYRQNARGALFVRGGEMVIPGRTTENAGDAYYRSALGFMGYSYVEVAGGMLRSIDTVNANYSAKTVIAVHGGEWRHDKSPAASGSSLVVGADAGARTHLYVDGGEVAFTNTNFRPCWGNDTVFTATLAGKNARMTTGGWGVNSGKGNEATININLLDGVFDLKYMGAATGPYTKPQRLFVNFDGGKVISRSWTNQDYEPFPWGDETNSYLTVYGGGAHIEIPEGFNTPLSKRIQAAPGQGVLSISLPDAVANCKSLVGSPYITIEGDGCGATAYAVYDSKTRCVTGVKVTSPGFNYTWAKAHFIEGSAYELAVVDCTVGENDHTGDFVKTGLGGLRLKRTNDWHGVTRILEGSLKQECDYAIPSNAIVRIDGGTLDLGEKEQYFKSFGGTSGVVRMPKGGTVRTEGLELGTTSALSFNRYYTVTVCGLWSVDVADLLAGETAQYESGIIFEEGSTLALGNTELLEDEAVQKNAPYTILSTVGTMKPDRTQGIVGGPTLVTELPKGWSVRKRGDKLVLKYDRGTLLIIR